MNGYIKVKTSWTYERILIIAFSILPLIDSINGAFKLPIGIAYKVVLLGALFLLIISTQRGLESDKLGYLILFILYIVFSISFNTIVFNGKLINTDYPVKLIYNASLLLALEESCRIGILDGDSFFSIIDNSAWVFCLCYLVPYVLKKGNSVYAGNIGYKAFFISQNELSFVIVVMAFFCANKLSKRFALLSAIQYVLILLCAILLNTKSTLIVCVLSAVFCVISVYQKGSWKMKLLLPVIAITGVIVLKNKFVTAIQSALLRYSTLKNNHYQGNSFTAILSDRNNFMNSAWNKLLSERTVFRFVFGNGFCSEYLTEMDIVDTFFYLGIVGALVVLAFLIIIFVKSYYVARDENAIILWVSVGVIIGFITFTGHVIFMAMSGCYFVLYCCYVLNIRKRR